MPKNISAATLMVLSACIIWGAQPMFVTFVVREFDPIPLVSIRYFTVGVMLLAALAYSGKKLLPPRKAWLPLFLMGVLRALAATMLRNSQACNTRPSPTLLLLLR